MGTALIIAAIGIIALILLKIFLKTLRIFFFIAVMIGLMVLWWLFQQGRLFHS